MARKPKPTRVPTVNTIPKEVVVPEEVATETKIEVIPDAEPEVTTEVEQKPEVTTEVEQKPEVTTEVIPKSEVEKDVTIEDVLGKLTVVDVLASNLSYEDKLNKIIESDETAYKMLASKLLGYQQVMSNRTIDPKLGASKQYDLYNTIVGALQTNDYGVFKIKMNIINLAFNAFKDSAYRDMFLFRFDEQWKWGAKELVTFQHLITVITTLADLATRKNNIKKIDMVKALDADEIKLSEDAKAHIQKYYNA